MLIFTEASCVSLILKLSRSNIHYLVYDESSSGWPLSEIQSLTRSNFPIYSVKLPPGGGGSSILP